MANKFTDFNPGITNNGGRKNFIINGAMDIWQNATSYSAITTSAWLADMFQFGINTDGSMNITRDSINAGVLSPFTPLYSIGFFVNCQRGINTL